MKTAAILMALTALVSVTFASPIDIPTSTRNDLPTRRAAATNGDTTTVSTADGDWTLVITSQSGTGQEYDHTDLNDVKDEYDDAIDDAAADATTATGTFDTGVNGYDPMLTLNTAYGKRISSYNRASWKLVCDAPGHWTEDEGYPSSISASIALENADIIGQVTFSYGQKD